MATEAPSRPSDAGTIRAALAHGSARLSEAGVDTPRLDAELLLAAALGSERSRLIIDAREPLAAAPAARYAALIARRADREPVAYLLGTRPFRRLELAVDPRVLIPRPETELLVEIGLGLPAGVRVADVGTGSGAIALALADERPDLALTGIDTSLDALAVAHANGERLGLAVKWICSDLLPDGDEADFDAVLANLPYVEADAALAPEIAGYEPPAALFAGPDGLDVIRCLVAQLASRPATRVLALEIGATQADAVEALVRAAGFAEVERRRDLAGHDRVVVGRR